MLRKAFFFFTILVAGFSGAHLHWILVSSRTVRDVVQAKRIELVSTSGKVLAALGTTAAGTGLSFLGSQGEVLGVGRLVDGSPYLNISNINGEIVSTLRVENGRPTMFFGEPGVEGKLAIGYLPEDSGAKTETWGVIVHGSPNRPARAELVVTPASKLDTLEGVLYLRNSGGTAWAVRPDKASKH